MDILLLKLKQELEIELNEYIETKSEGNTTVDIKSIIDEKVKPELFQLSINDYDECKCNARLWDKGYQCTHTKKSDSDYCDKHNRMIRYEGVLRFGDIREPKPKYDQIKLKNGIKDKLNWIHPDPLIRLQNLLDKHQKKLIEAAPKLVVR